MPGFDNIYQAWLNFLAHAEPLLGIPLCAGGAALVLMGWRLWKFVAAVDLALLGGVAAFLYFQLRGETVDWRWVAGAAVLFGAAGVAFARYTAPLLGGIAGGLVGFLVVSALGLYGSLLWVVGGLALAASAAWAYSYRQQVEAVLSSAEGGVLLASGLAVMLPEVPVLYRFFSSMTATSPFMIGFYILVPTVVGVTMQQADLNRSTSKSARAS